LLLYFNIVFLVQRTKTTVAISSFLFLLGSLIADLYMGGVYSASGYSVTKMALGSLGIGLGFGLPCIIYTNEKLSRSVQIAIHMVTGCAIMLTIAFLVGWIPTDISLLKLLICWYSIYRTQLWNIRIVAVKIRLYVVLCGIFSKKACFKLER